MGQIAVPVTIFVLANIKLCGYYSRTPQAYSSTT